MFGQRRVIYDIRFHNHTGKSVTVRWYNNILRIPSDQVGIVHYLAGSKLFVVEFDDGQTWHYLAEPITQAMKSGLISLQLEPDGRLYLLAPSSTQVRDLFPVQPNGFPLIPK